MKSWKKADAVEGLDSQVKGLLDGLATQLDDYAEANKTKVAYYEAKQSVESLNIALPNGWEKVSTVLGWPAKAVDTLERRISLQGFVTRSGVRHDLADQVFIDNALRAESIQAHTSALIHGCAFLTVFLRDGVPVIQPVSALNGTGVWDAQLRRLSAGLSVNDRNKEGEPTSLTLWLPESVLHIDYVPESDDWDVWSEGVRVPRVHMSVLAFHPRPGRPFGHSRITRPLMSMTDHAVRTMARMELGAEFFATPQRYLNNLPEKDREALEKAGGWSTLMGRMLLFESPEKNEFGENDPPVSVGQFPQMSMQPHIEQLQAIAKMVAGETCIPLNYFGVVQDNPSSADAIRVQESELCSVGEEFLVELEPRWVEGMRLACCLAGADWDDPELAGMSAVWRDVATPTRAASAQSVVSLVAAGVLPAQSDVTLEMLDLDPVTVSRVMAEHRVAQSDNLLSSLGGLTGVGAGMGAGVGVAGLPVGV